MSDESRLKISNIAKKRGYEHKEKIKKSILLKREEINRNISKALTGRKLSGNALIKEKKTFLGKTSGS